MTTIQDTGRFRTNLSDKFYTITPIAIACLQHLLSHVENPGGFVWIEPAAGSGVFIDALKGLIPIITTIGIDLAPTAINIIKADFLSWEPSTEDIRPRIFFGNPPFGRQSSLARKFIGRACDLSAKWVAFILPRSFEKPSLQRVFPRNYHCRLSTRLAENAFLVNDKPYDVPCVFQIWERTDSPRNTEIAADPCGYTYVKSDETYDFVVRRVGVYAGRAILPGIHARQSHYFLRLNVATTSEKKAEIIRRISQHVFPTNTTGPRSLSKGEVNVVVNAIIAEVLAEVLELPPV